MYNLNVIIIGGGIGGLTLALLLKKEGYRVSVYERYENIRPAGAAISLWSNGVKVLNRLHLGNELAALGGQMDSMVYYDKQGDEILDVDLRPLYKAVGQRAYPVARTELHDMLMNAVGRENVHLGMQCVGVEEDSACGLVTAVFSDNTRVCGDLLVGADGAHSVIRPHVVPEVREFFHYVNWNGLAPKIPALKVDTNWSQYVADGKRAAMMPVGKDQVYFFFGAPLAPNTEVPKERRQDELREIFADFPPPVLALIDTMQPDGVNRLDIGDMEPLDRFCTERVVLIGDAAHQTTPTLGQGGCQALEDAEVLTRCLITTTISIEDALQRYQAERIPRSAEMVLGARKRTQTMFNPDPAVHNQWYQDLKKTDPEAIRSGMERNLAGGPMR